MNVSNLPTKTKAKYLSIRNSYPNKNHGILASNLYLLQNKQEFIANSEEAITKVTFDIIEEEFITQNDVQERYVTGVIAKKGANKKGLNWSEESLLEMRDAINSDSFIADEDHILYNELMSGNHTTEYITQALKSKSGGVAKTVKAIYENGKLFVRFLVDKAMDLSKFTGISIEGLFKRDKDTNTVLGGTFMGLTFTKNTTAAMYETGLISGN